MKLILLSVDAQNLSVHKIKILDVLVVVGKDETGEGELFSNGMILDDGGPVSTVMYMVASSFSLPPLTTFNKDELRSHP